ncbi:MAG: catalase [Methylophilaceae bacterium]
MLKRYIKRLGLALLALALILVAFIAYHMQIHADITAKEVVPANESADIKVAAQSAVGIIKALKTSYAARGVHAKGHACVKAFFTVSPVIDAQLRYGVFSTPGKQYQSWIRFSNSGSNMANADDRAKDARGMAIKVLNVGQNINGGTTQEFIAHNSPAFFVTSVADYNKFVDTKGDPAYFVQGYNPFKWRLRELWQLITAYSPPPKSPLWTEYFSNTAYKLGPHNIKFKMRSCAEPSKIKADVSQDPDFLKHTLATELAEKNACMLLMVQVQDTSKTMPIEDATVLWQETEVSFVPVATLDIIQQTFDTPEQQQFCENLSFNPWNALADEQPVGALNRARRWVYAASSDYRHAQNKTTIPQDLNW